MASVCSRFCQENVTMDKNSPKVALEDCICPICMCILIEPVTMPCQHELCMPCFKKNVEEASLTCPMCRTRISVWARQAARNRTLVNKDRWTQIRNLFPVKVQRRLEGNDDDSSDEVLNVSKPQIAEPGEIRKEYEEQVRKLREEYEKDRRREHEASQRLILELQAEEERKRAEQKNNLKLIEQQDHDLAEELDHVINEAGANEPIDLLMQENQKRMTRSSSSNSNDGRPQESGKLENFMDRIRQKSQCKITDPYPFACLTPSQKDAGSSQRASTGISGLFGDKNYIRPETITISSSSSSLQDMFTPVSSVPPAPESNKNTPTYNGPKRLTENTVGDNMHSVPTASTSTSHSLLGEILSAESPVPSSSTAGSTVSCIKNVKSSHVIGSDKVISSSTSKRCASTESTDSISPETWHFKPIQCCPRTPPRKVNGKVVEAPIIFTTPRNLNKLELCFNHENSKHMLELNEKSPVIKKRLMILATDRKRHVEANSKSTSTEHVKNASKTENVPLSMTKSDRFSSVVDPPMLLKSAKLTKSPTINTPVVLAGPKQLNLKGHSVMVSLAKPQSSNAKAPCTISSQTQLDENCNENPRSSFVKQVCGNVSKPYKLKKNTKRPHSPQIGSGDSVVKPLLPLVSCIDDMDELDGSPPLPESFCPGKLSAVKSGNDTWNMSSDTLVGSPSIKSSPQNISRDLFKVKTEPKTEKVDLGIKCPLTYSKQKRKKNLKRQKKTSRKEELKSPQLSLKDMFQRIQRPSPNGCVSPAFNSTSSTPSLDEGSVNVKSLINKAISSLDEDVISDRLPLQTSVFNESENSNVILKDSDPASLNNSVFEKEVNVSMDAKRCVNCKQVKSSSRNIIRQPASKGKGKKKKKNIKVVSPPNTLDKFMQHLNNKKDSSTTEIVQLTSSGRKRRRPQRFGDDEKDVSLSCVKKLGKVFQEVGDSKVKQQENLPRRPIDKCDLSKDSCAPLNIESRRTQSLSVTQGKVNAREAGSSPIKTVQTGCSSSSRRSKNNKGKAESARVSQEELDRRLAFDLQKQFDTEVRQESIVDRRKGSTDEYSLRKRPQKSKTK